MIIYQFITGINSAPIFIFNYRNYHYRYAKKDKFVLCKGSRQ